MPDFVRRIVSGPKARYVDPKLGFDLDLVYVTDRLIIMGWPASHIEALYRNRRKDVRKFLDAKHGEHYRIYNLCPCIENTYDSDEFYGEVSRYPFPDHHPPPLSMIPMFVADITAFFAENPSNVAVIHCKAGKGRSGTMACSYLLSLPILPPCPQSSRNCGNKHDRMLLDEKRKANKEAAASKGEESEKGSDLTPSKSPPLQFTSPTLSPSTEPQDVKLQELTTRLNAVFEFHTSRRLKPAKSTSSSSGRSNLRSQKSTTNLTQLDDTIAPAMVKTDSSNSNKMSPIQNRKSFSNLVGSLSRKASRTAFDSSPRSDGAATSPPGKEKSESQNNPRLGSKSLTNLRALGASPAGTSRTNLGDHLEPPVPPMPAVFSRIHRQGSDPDPWASNLSIGDISSLQMSEASGQSPNLSILSDQNKSRLSVPMSPNRSHSSSSGQSPPRIGSPEETDFDVDGEKGEEVDVPRLAVSIPSQRRWVGYWARMLAGMDPRAALDSCLMHPRRRKVKILQVYVDRRATSDNEEGHLSVQISRYNEQLIDRVETWERGARRRQRVFGALDPGAPSPSLVPSDAETGDAKKDDERRWKDCEKRNKEHQEEYIRTLRQHGNDKGVGQWGVNVMAERDALRHFHWDDEEGSHSPDQMEAVAMVSEQARFKLSESDATHLMSNTDLMANTTEEASILRYVFEPGRPHSTHYGHTTPRMTWTKPSATVGGLGRLLQGVLGQKKPEQAQTDADVTASNYNHLHSPSNTSSDTWPSHLSTTPPPTTESLSSVTSDDEYVRASVVNEGKGVIVDGDREVQFKILLGRSGATHAKLPDMLSAGYLWFIPAFETPTVNGKTCPKKGQVVKCQFGIGEIDFRKGKKAAPLMGGGDIRSITIEFEWIEVGWHEDDVDSDEE